MGFGFWDLEFVPEPIAAFTLRPAPAIFPLMSNFDFRFGGIARLFGVETLARLRAAHVCVVGVGGVGSWAVEALARSGVGKLTLVDLDEV